MHKSKESGPKGLGFGMPPEGLHQSFLFEEVFWSKQKFQISNLK